MGRINPDEVFYLNRMGFSDKRIAKKLHVSRSGVVCVRYKLGLKANYLPFVGDNVNPQNAHKNILRKERIRYEANRDKIIANGKAYYLKNQDKVKNYQKNRYNLRKNLCG